MDTFSIMAAAKNVRQNVLLAVKPINAKLVLMDITKLLIVVSIAQLNVQTV